MKGTSDICVLLKNMKPELCQKKFVFCTAKKEESIEKLALNPLLVFHEKEGVTVILEKEEADKNTMQYSAIWALITLTVHSDLEAVGFLAKISEKMAEAGISINVVSAFYHDHLFVPFGKREEAMKVLRLFQD